MTPVFKAKDMVNLGTQQFYIKMTIDGDTYDPFSAETLKVLPSTHESFEDQIIEFSRKTYAAPLEQAKRKIIDEENELLGLKSSEGDAVDGSPTEPIV